MKRTIIKLICAVLCISLLLCACAGQGGKTPETSSKPAEPEYSKITYKNFIFTDGDVFLPFDPGEDVNYNDFEFQSYDSIPALAEASDAVFCGVVNKVYETLVPFKDMTLSELENNRGAYPDNFEENIYSYELYTIAEMTVGAVYSGDLKQGDTVYFAELGDGKHRRAGYVDETGGYPRAGDTLLLFAELEKSEKYPDRETYLDGKQIELYSATSGRRYFVHNGKTDAVKDAPVPEGTPIDNIAGLIQTVD